MAKRRNFDSMFKKTDMYASKVGVKVDGKPSMKSKCGAFITVLIVLVLVGFTGMRLVTVVTMDEAITSSKTTKSAYLDAQVFKASTIGFNVAFGLLKMPERGSLAQYGHFELNALQELGELNKTVSLSFFDCSDEQLEDFYDHKSETFK